ncbi:CTP synthase 1-like [Sinocyclocheilus rhinocerous]|uniref:CTP synthase 1-like n=1 Tax=Sinocyclocheilus rhinocerous TaxID=307959 RepID=UPI0007B844FA|nr:PREDICTED: CTP synthase 1-like [Sinocyclocheilus rhinocerous]
MCTRLFSLYNSCFCAVEIVQHLSHRAGRAFYTKYPNISSDHPPVIGRMKYILVTGGVISGIGKGIIASSVGTILKSCGLRVTAIKIDPYINIDAGTFSPYEHGEVFVLDDGGEVDLDLGNYERFLDIRLTKDNNLTTGKIYQSVINKERRGDYLGKTVQVVPHITDAIQEWVMRQAQVPVDDDGVEPQVCVIELGGTVGDIESMPFIEAFRQFQFKVKRENFCNIHVSLVPQPSATGEQKTKPTQNSVRELRGLGLSPDLIMCRCSTPLENSVKEKISMFCHVEPEQVSLDHTGLKTTEAVEITVEHRPGAYVDSADLEASTLQEEPVRYHEAWQKLCSANGILVPGGFGVRGTEGKIQAISWARKQKKPFLGVCLGMQLAVCEFARNMLDWKDANSTEFDPETKHPVVIDMPEHNPGQMGGTMRLGKRRTIFKTKNSILSKHVLHMEASKLKLVMKISPCKQIWYRVFVLFLGVRAWMKPILFVLCEQVNPELKQHFEEKGFRFVGQDVEGERMEVIELDDHPYFVGVQYHPEFTSRPIKPSPPYFGLLLAAAGRLPGYLQKGCRLSPRETYSDRSGSSSPDSEIADFKLPSLAQD